MNQAFMTAILQENPRRAAGYALVLVALAAAFALRLSSLASAGEAVFAFGEILMVAVAAAAGGLALQRYRAEQRDAFLLISAGLWVAAALHLFHFAAYTGVFGGADSVVTSAATLRGALLPTLFLALFLVLSLLAGRQDRPSTAQPAGVFAAAGTLALIMTIASLLLPIPSGDGLVRVLAQPIPVVWVQPELLLAVALTLGGIVSIRGGVSWRSAFLTRWLLAAFIATLVALLRFPILSAWPQGGILLLAHGLTLASYLCIVVGIVTGKTEREFETSEKAVAGNRLSPEPEAIPEDQEEQEESAPGFSLYVLESRHRALRNATDGLLVGVRGDGTITDWKPAVDFGSTALPSDVLGKNIRELLPADQAAAVMAAVAQALLASKTEELQFAAADGSVALGGYVTPYTGGQALCIIRDHTAHVRALHELEELRSAADSLRKVTGDWLIRMTSTGTIQELHPPAAEPAAYGDMFNGKHVQDVFQGDDVTPLTAAAAAALASGEVQELAFLRQSGQVLAVRVTAYAENAALCLLRDITELKETAAQLQESEEANQELRAHLQRLTTEQASALNVAESSVRVLRNLLPDLVLRLRADGTILECKPAESFGPQEAASIVDAKVREVLPVDLASHMMAAIERAQNDQQPQRFTCHPIGGQVLAGGIAALVDDQYLCVVRDQTQQKQMETALAQQAAVLAQEMQVKLEEESLRALRAENDALRAHLLRVAQVALAAGQETPPVDATADASATPDSATREDTGETQDSIKTGASASRADTVPAQTREELGTPAEAPTSPPTQAAGRPASVLPDESREVDTLANGEPVRRGAEASVALPSPSSADTPAAATTNQAETAVATKAETRPEPTMTDNGQADDSALTNGEPAEGNRPA